MTVHIHFRSDDWWIANRKAIGQEYSELCDGDHATYETITPASPGDIWRMHWAGPEVPNIDGRSGEGPLAGYAICCPKCRNVHCWNTATNCTFQLTEHTYAKSDGTEGTYKVCGHSGKASCWDWTGSAEEGTLTASPSLLCHTCGYHGWLRNGALTD